MKEREKHEKRITEELHKMFTDSGESLSGARGGGTRIIVLYTCTTREARKRIIFLGLTCFARFAIRGQNVPIFEKRVLLDSMKGR